MYGVEKSWLFGSTTHNAHMFALKHEPITESVI